LPALTPKGIAWTWYVLVLVLALVAAGYFCFVGALSQCPVRELAPTDKGRRSFLFESGVYLADGHKK
jgi:hypothetical protein